MPEWPGALGLLGVFLFLCLTSLPYLSLTTDEPIHYRYGRRVLESDAGRFDDSVMPVSALNAFPAWLGERLPDSPLSRGLRHFQVARLPTLAAAILLGGLVYTWSRRLYGAGAGLLSLFLFTFDPNILAHSRLITQDVFLAATIALTAHATWRFARRRTLARALSAALFLGLAQLTKYTAVALFPILATSILLYDLPRLIRLRSRIRWSGFARYGARAAAFSLIFLATAVAVINVGFLREYTFRPLADYQFRSTPLRHVQELASAAGWFPVPVPRPYLEGLDQVIAKEREGQGHGRLYLLGQLREEGRFPGYFLIAYLLKVPIGTQAIAALSMVLVVRRWSWVRFWRREQFLIVPLLSFLYYFNVPFRAQIGLRFILMTFPILHILAGQVVQSLSGWNRLRRVLLAVGLGSLALSTLSYHPDYLAYFNEIVWERRLAYQYLADSNLDWGQSEEYLKEYLALHPAARVEPPQITDGEIIVRVNNLVGITEDPDRYRPLREGCLPAATIGHAYLLYYIPCPPELQTRP
jgi:hypothetical protein